MKTTLHRSLHALTLASAAYAASVVPAYAADHPFEGSYSASAPRGSGTVNFTFVVDDGGSVAGKIPSTSGRQVDLLGAVSSGGQITLAAFEMATPVYFASVSGTLTRGANGTVTGRGEIAEPQTQTGDQTRIWTARRTVAPVTRRAISGRVVNSQGVGIPNVVVRRSGSNEARSTNTSGGYTFEDVTPGAYTLTASRDGLTFSPSAVRATVGAAGSATVTAPPMLALFQVKGRVSLPDFGSVPGVRVVRSGSAVASVTNAQGEFLFSGVPSGTVTLSASRPGLAFAPPSQSVRITAANPAPVRFSTSYAVTGRVVDARGVGIAGVTLSRGAARVVTDASGGYAFPGLGATTFFVTPSKPGLTFAPASQRATTTGGSVVLPFFRGTAPSTPGA